MKTEKQTWAGILGGIHLWSETTVPLSVAVLLCHIIGVPMVRAEQGRVEQVVISGSIKLSDPGIPGASGMEGMEPVEGAPAMVPVERPLNPRPAAAESSVERRAEMMAQARAEEGFFRPQGGGLRSIHRKSLIQLDYGFDGLRFSPHDPAALPAFTGATKPPRWTVRMKTESMEVDGVAFNFGEPGSPVADGERVSCGLGDGCVEWVVNRAGGFEHGYTITAPPVEGKPASELAMVISLETSLSVIPGDDGLLFQDQAGKTRMSYSGLMVFDVEGREFESAMVLNEVGDELRLEADVRGAVFPITVDPVVTATAEQLMAMGGASGDEYGKASDGCDDVVAISAPGRGSGVVYVHHEDQGGPGEWGEVSSLTIPASESPQNGDRFGESVAVFKVEDTGQKWIAVGAPNHGANGAVFVFSRDEGGDDNWGFVQKLTVDEFLNESQSLRRSGSERQELVSGAGAGTGMDANDRILLVGAPFVAAGLVFSFILVNGLFQWRQTIAPPPQFNPIAGNFFGIAIAIAVGIAVIGASGENEGRGGAYLLQLVVATGLFSILFRLFSDKSEIGAAFGAVVAIALLGTMIAIASPRDVVNELGPALVNAGMVTIYAFTALAGWAFLTALFGKEANGFFGSSMDFDFLNNLLVGATGALTRVGLIAGAVFLFLFNPYLFNFDPPQKIVPDLAFFIDAAMALGTSLVIVGTMLFIAGAAYNLNQGAAFRIVLLPVVLTFALWLKQFFSDDEIAKRPDLTAPDADPDRDGIANILEYLLFLIPVIANVGFFVGWVANGNFHVPFRQSLSVVGAILVLQYALSLSGWFATANGPLAGLFQFLPRYRGITANEYVVVIPLILALLLFMRLDGRLEPS